MWRNQNSEQDARRRRIVQIGHIGVPFGFTTAKPSDRLAIDDDIGDRRHVQIVDLRAPFRTQAADRDLLQRAESLAESLQAALVKGLSPEAQHAVVKPCLVDILEVIIRNTGKVNARNVSPKAHTNRFDLNHVSFLCRQRSG